MPLSWEKITWKLPENFPGRRTSLAFVRGIIEKKTTKMIKMPLINQLPDISAKKMSQSREMRGIDINGE